MASIENLINNLSSESISSFFQSKIGSFAPDNQPFPGALGKNEDYFEAPIKIGEAALKNNDNENLLVFSCKCNGALHERSGRKKQHDIAKRILKEDFTDGAIFIFYDQQNNFRFSFIRQNWGETKDNRFTTWKRYTYLVSQKEGETNKTFINRIGNCDFSTLDTIQEAFSVAKLTKEFYEKLFAWYQWAISAEVGITFPNIVLEESENPQKTFQEQIIRLITRLLFVWFVKQKDLVPANLFDETKLGAILKNFDPASAENGDYYNAILQNLFFATLNKKVEERGFTTTETSRDIKTKYRFEDEMFTISKGEILELFHQIPFLNGGLFECLDREKGTDDKKEHLDGFSRNDKKTKDGKFKYRTFLPNNIFFDKKKGLIPLLKSYNFTVEENAPNEIQVALDPELLGKVFENLLGAFNPETQTTARKSSGSFYTPRKIVEYMVDETLLAYLKTKLPKQDEALINDLIKDETLPQLLEKDKLLQDKFITALKKIKILDPACGSGAFPMGILRRMVEVLEKLDSQDHYDLKLHLIEECIYGIDIQPIATQISRLRFFISLVVDQDDIDFNKPKDNYGIKTLPNLETKFVAANALIGLSENEEGILDLSDKNIKKYKQELLDIRHKHFYAKSTSAKRKLRLQDEQTRENIKNYLTKNATTPNQEKIKEAQEGIAKLKEQRKDVEDEDWQDVTESQTSFLDASVKESALFKKDMNADKRNKIDSHINHYQKQISNENKKSQSTGLEKEIENLTDWNPYDQNKEASFFDLKWMFGIEDGFDIVIGNPPYIQLQNNGGKLANKYRDSRYETFASTGDIYSLFYECGFNLLKENSTLCFITSNKWMRAGYGNNTREFFVNNTNPIRLIDFAGHQVFDSATVDTNILLFRKSKYTQETKTCVIKEKFEELENYIDNNSNYYKFKNNDSWVVLSPIEQRIKEKIERIGTPLKDWDINIYRGILTGYNKAFIIDGKKRDELIKEDTKSAEIIRPILRGRDIKRYGYDFADKWLINTHNGIRAKNVKPVNINDYPAVKQHLDQYYEKLEKRQDKGITPYNLRNCAYMEDFSKQKIMYPNMTKFLPFYLDNKNFVQNDKSFFITGKHIEFLTAYLNSSIFKYCFINNFTELQGGTRELRKVFLEQISVLEVSQKTNQEFRKIM